jgi:hypothetical protein
MVNDLLIAEIKLYQIIAIIPAFIPEAVVISGISAKIKVAEPTAVL